MKIFRPDRKPPLFPNQRSDQTAAPSSVSVPAAARVPTFFSSMIPLPFSSPGVPHLSKLLSLAAFGILSMPADFILYA